MRYWLLICLLFLAACSTPQPVVKTKYIERPPLVLPTVEKPILSEPYWKLTNEQVCTDKQSFENVLQDLVELKKYIEKLNAQIDAYKKHQEKKK